MRYRDRTYNQCVGVGVEKGTGDLGWGGTEGRREREKEVGGFPCVLEGVL